MIMYKIIGQTLKNMPWEERPKDHKDPVWRYSKNPLIGRNPVSGIARIFNSAVVPFKDRFVGVFRAEDTATLPHLRLGWSQDGFKWTFDELPVPLKDSNGDSWLPHYAYDPRLVEIDHTYHVIWCTDFYGPTIGLARTADFVTFERLENAFLPFNRNGVLFPRKINGTYRMLSRPSDSGHTPFGDIFLSESPDLVHWGRHRHVMERGGSGWWQNLKIGSGPAPIETDQGWLLLYHGVTQTCSGYIYSMGAALLDLDEPSKVLYRSRVYCLTPELDYETIGFVPNVVFPCAALCDASSGRIAIYYGAADTTIALAFTHVDDIINFIINNHESIGRDGSASK
ncbi:MAG: glycosylase [Acholeplasmataceae bacterium]|nr:MAG: glycosylase [Acholeplasmataceae bacterium]